MANIEVSAAIDNLLKSTPSTTVTTAAALTALGAVVTGGAATGLNMSTAKILGRTTASAGAVEEITVGSGLSLTGGNLTATGTGALPSTQIFVGNGSNVATAVAMSGDIAITNTGVTSITSASTNGGANKILQMDADGNLRLGPTYSGTTQFDSNGNLFMPDLHGIQWYKRDGSKSGYRIFPWEQHDGYGGEFLIEAPWRIALACKGPVQMGVNDVNRNAYALWLVTGSSTVTDQYRASKAILQATTFYNGGSPITRSWGHQAWPISGTESVLRFAVDANVDGFAGFGGPTATTGDLTGDVSVEFHRQGVWSRGTAPAWDILSEAAPVQTCSIYKTVQAAKLTLNTASRTLTINGAVSGMRGVIYVKQSGAGSFLLTLPTNSAKVSSFALSTAAGLTDRLQWEFDGSYYFWTISNAIQVPLDADVAIFVDAARANITDTTQKDALNNLVTSLKASNVEATGTLWSKFSVLYPFVGGNATAHSRNLKSTSYDITWVNTATHDANGVTGIVANSAYGNTGFAMNTLDQNSMTVYAYCKTPTPTTSTYFLGVTALSGTARNVMAVNGTSQLTVASNTIGDHDGQNVSGSFAKHHALIRTLSTEFRSYANSSERTQAVASVAPLSTNQFLFARNNNGSPSGYTNANLAFIGYGAGLTATEYTAFRAIIDTFQTALSRANA